MIARGAVVVSLLLGACHFGDIDLTGKQCPCPADWVCEPTTNTSERSALADDASTDTRAIDTPGGPDLTSNLFVWFKLDESSGQVANDSSPNANYGHLYDDAVTTWQPTGGVHGGALFFPGTQSKNFVMFRSTDGMCPNPPQIAGSFTASAWVKFDAFGTWDNYSLSDGIFFQGNNGGSEGGWGLGATDACGGVTKVGLFVTPSSNSSARSVRCGTTALSTSVWYHVTGVYDASVPSLTVYLNGVDESGGTAGGAVPTALHTPSVCIYLGAASNQDKALRGTLDNTRVYQRALTAAEVAALYAAGG